MQRKVIRANRACWLLAAALVTACSLTVPSESDVFGGSGAGGHAGGGAGAQSGAPAQAGMPNGGDNAEAGSSVGGSQAGSNDNEPGGMGGDLGEAGSAPLGAAGEPPVGPLPPAVLYIHYDFDDVSQMIAKDSSGSGRDGTLAGLSLPTGTAGHIGGALAFDGTQQQYVQLPNDILADKDGISVAAWIRLAQAVIWDRLFDFNSSEANWFYFSPTGWNAVTNAAGTRCAARTTAELAPEIMLTKTLSVGAWHHVAVVFAKPFLRYYLDGVLQSEQTKLDFGPDGLGKTNHNWIGRSVYTTDPYLSGAVDDFRIYTGALTEAEVLQLAAQ